MDEEELLSALKYLQTGHDKTDAIAVLACLFEMEIFVKQHNFNLAVDLFKSFGCSKEYSFSVLKRMAGIILLDTECPLDVAFLVLKTLHSSPLILETNVDDYAKWTCLYISTAVKRNDINGLYEGLKSVIDQQMYKKVRYPQRELYYLIVIAWNEGMTCYLKSDPLGEYWCKIAFELLRYLTDEGKKEQLSTQMEDACRLFQIK
ncbi:MAG: hypothetical protein EXX96DRAFT_615288 [Benjaminiella poitrasii]|nr:MAG: hypothetical protein EXX96DRAFT_615288 [Benjaminiella poitrasii]